MNAQVDLVLILLLACAGYSWTDIAPCVQWMAPYATTLREAGSVEVKFFSQIPPDTTHNIQTHVVDLSLLVSIILMCLIMGMKKI